MKQETCIHIEHSVKYIPMPISAKGTVPFNPRIFVFVDIDLDTSVKPPQQLTVKRSAFRAAVFVTRLFREYNETSIFIRKQVYFHILIALRSLARGQQILVPLSDPLIAPKK